MNDRQKEAAAAIIRTMASLPIEERVEVLSTVVQVFTRFRGLVRAAEQPSAGPADSPGAP